MKNIISIGVLSVFLVSTQASALVDRDYGADRALLRMERATDRDGDEEESQPEIVNWRGRVEEVNSAHSKDHDHELRFIRENGDSYDIKDSPELVKLHHDTEKNYQVEIEAEKTSQFLFWGGDLIVKSFRVISEVALQSTQVKRKIDRALRIF